VNRAWVPILGALAQGVVVLTPGGSVDRPVWALTVAAACGLASGLALWWRDRSPLVTTVGTATGYLVQAGIAGPVLPVALTVSLYAATRRASAARAAVLAGVISGACVLVATALLINGHAGLVAIYSVVLLAAVVAGLASALREGRLLATRQAAVVEERLRIARDLHDIVGHGMGAITVQAGAGRIALGAGAVDDATRALATIESAGREMLREVRWLVGILREDSRRPTLADVPDLAAAFRRAGIGTNLETRGDLSVPEADVGDAAYRIIQEALTNSLRHGRCELVSVTVHVADQVVIDVEDDGSSAPASDAGGHGLRGMRERAAAVGGVLRAGPSPAGTGWTVHAELPLRGRA
jgi:signal transduction histidine kinase